MNQRLIIVMAAPPILLILALLALTQIPSRPTMAPGASPPPSVPAAPGAALPPPAPAPVVVPPAPPPPVATKLDLSAVSSPQSTVASAMRFLDLNDQARFRQTLLPSVAAKLDDGSFARCRAKVAQSPVTPDWEVAERTEQDGHAVVRVSMFGKSMTGFHEEHGAWLADALWCLPTGVP